MPRKAQAEFAIILGLVIIAAVVGIYAYTNVIQPSLQPAVLTEEQKSVSSRVGDLLSSAATSTLSQMYKNGGYVDGSGSSLGYVSHKALGKRISLWQMCGNYEIPNMEEEFSTGMKNYLATYLPDSEMIGGRSVVYAKSAASVTSRFYDNKIVASINLPTTVDGAVMPQPYTIDVATKMGRVYEFSKNFAKMQADCRVLDNSLLISLSQSNEFSRPCWIPTVGVAERSHTFTWKNLRDCMEMHVKYSLSNTLLGEEVPVKDGKVQTWGLEFFSVPAVIDYATVPEGSGVCSGTASAGSKEYDDLYVTFYFGDDSGLDRSEFAAPEHLMIRPKTGPENRYMGGLKVGQYVQRYSVRYPVVVNVWDSSMQRSFKFAVFVYVDNNDIGECSTVPMPRIEQTLYNTNTYDSSCVDDATEDANILVRYTDGSDVVGATVSFFGCDLGTTGKGEPVTAKVPASWGPLTVKDGNTEHTRCYMHSELKNLVLTIPKSEKFLFSFYTVDITKSGSTYTISSVSPATEPAEAVLSREWSVCSPAEPEVVLNLDDDGIVVPSLTVNNLPVDEYGVAVSSYSGQDVSGYVNATGFTPSGSAINVYAPEVSGFTPEDIDGIKSLYESCGIAPVTIVDYSGKVGCSWSG